MSSLASSMDSDSTTCTDKYGRELPPKAFRSKRLEVISYNTRDHDEFFNSIQQYSSSIINFCASTPRPMDLKFTSSVANHQKKSHLFVIIYGAYDDYDDDVVPIGTLFLEASPRDMTHHRCSKLGIGILNRFRRYEAEAVNWALNWAFNSAGSTPGGDEYSDMEHASEWWDEVNLSILKREWRQLHC
ncbi:Acyl-CoA N-acyltransferase [Penicillium fimorum]|uniref:Acyl-CoA N-acyltransferase n=1 Tax=Penicillium fimorum TaxID=1882269 RepID=A0A9X0C472_9EURO|nr:Acyl-CoA N-acyltransferase [Penicillium fimorum]